MKTKITLILALALIIPHLVSAQVVPRHTSGDVDMGITDFGSLAGGVLGNFLFPNFKYPAHADEGNFYLNPFSEIWVGDADGNVASALDGFLDEQTEEWGIALGEWQATDFGAPSYTTDSTIRQEITSEYAIISEARLPFDILVDQHTYSWNAVAHPEAKDFVVLKLTLINRLAIEVDGLYVAIAANWDIDMPNRPGEPNFDLVDWDDERHASIVYDADETDGLEPAYMAVALLDGELSAHQIVNVSSWRYLDANRSVLMSTPEKDTLQTIGGVPGDYLTVISSGPYKIRPKNTKPVIFAFVAGENLDALKANIDTAKKIVCLPDMLKTEPKNKAVRISWRPAISERMSYQVFRSKTSGSGYVQISPRFVDGSAYDDIDVENGVRYYYILRSVDANGQVLPFDTEEISAIPDEEPTAPQELKADVINTQIHLEWNQITGDNLKGYNIYRNFTGEEPWTLIKSVEISATSFIDENTYPGNVYYYTVTAVKESGMQSQFSPITDAEVKVPVEKTPEIDLNNVIVAPNPCKYSTNGVRFINLTPKSTIYIYSSTGELVRKLEHNDDTNVETWNLNNSDENPVASGVYVYYVTASEAEGREELKASGKIAVVK